MNTNLRILALGLLAAAAVAVVEAPAVAGDTAGQITFRMNRIDSVRDFYTRYFGQAPPYRERGDEDWQDSITRCLFAYGNFKAKRLDTVILYAGRDPNDTSNLICNVFPINEAAHMRLCEGIGMTYVSSDDAKYELTCAEKPARLGLNR